GARARGGPARLAPARDASPARGISRRARRPGAQRAADPPGPVGRIAITRRGVCRRVPLRRGPVDGRLELLDDREAPGRRRASVDRRRRARCARPPAVRNARHHRHGPSRARRPRRSPDAQRAFALDRGDASFTGRLVALDWLLRAGSIALIVARRCPPRLRVLDALDLSPLIADIPISYSARSAIIGSVARSGEVDSDP